MAAGHAPRACHHCLKVKPAEEFAWGAGVRSDGTPAKYRRRRAKCIECEAELAAIAASKRERHLARAATWEEDGVVVRRCSGCHEVKRLDTEFYFVKGDARYRCKVCDRANSARYRAEHKDDPDYRTKRREMQRSYRERNPEKVRAWKREQYARLKADPERYARLRESQRIDHRLRRERRDGVDVTTMRRTRLVAVPSPPADTDETLPTIQLAAALRSLADHLDQDIEAVCERAGVNARTVFFWHRGWRTDVALETADEALTRLGLLWWDVWNEETVRVPLVTVELYRPYTKRLPSGNVSRYVDRGRRTYGDGGVDVELLGRIERLWEGSPEDEHDVHLELVAA